jgi:PAS domain S-box-containing protein
MELKSMDQLLADFGSWLEYVPDAVFVVGPAGQVVLANNHAEQLFRQPSDKLLGQPIETLIPDRFRSDHAKHREDYDKTPHVRLMGSGKELTALRSDGTEFPAEISLGPLPVSEGTAVFAVIRDLTERRRMEARLREYAAQALAAKMIQQQLLPESPPEAEGYDIAGLLVAAEPVGGDHYEFLRFPDGRLGFVVSDVAGQGIGPVQFMALTVGRLRRLAEAGRNLEEILQETNETLATEPSPPSFVTLYLGCLDPTERTWWYTSAGHAACCVLDAQGTVKSRMEATSIPLAVLTGARFPMADPVALDSGDVLVLLTNGILEVRNAEGVAFGVDRCLQLVHQLRDRCAKEILAELFRSAQDFMAGDQPVDDLTSVVIKVEG